MTERTFHGSENTIKECLLKSHKPAPVFEAIEPNARKSCLYCLLSTGIRLHPGTQDKNLRDLKNEALNSLLLEKPLGAMQVNSLLH